MEGYFETVLSCFENSKIRVAFLESPGTVLGRESCFVFAVFAVFALTNKVSKILKIIQQKNQLK